MSRQHQLAYPLIVIMYSLCSNLFIAAVWKQATLVYFGRITVAFKQKSPQGFLKDKTLAVSA